MNFFLMYRLEKLFLPLERSSQKMTTVYLFIYLFKRQSIVGISGHLAFFNYQSWIMWNGGTVCITSHDVFSCDTRLMDRCFHCRTVPVMRRPGNCQGITVQGLKNVWDTCIWGIKRWVLYGACWVQYCLVLRLKLLFCQPFVWGVVWSGQTIKKYSYSRISAPCGLGGGDDWHFRL